MDLKLWLLIPAYNEEDCIQSLLEKISAQAKERGWNYEIVVCNDGSRDKTAEILEANISNFPMKVLTHKINRGLGETERDLFEYAAEHAGDEDVIVRVEADDTNEPRYISDMVDKLAQGYDVVVASRFAEGGDQKGVTGYRAFISRGANLFMKLFFPIAGLQEYSCGYRAYRASILKKAVAFFGNDFIQLKGLGFTCTLETIVKLRILNARFSEVPFVLRYDQKQSSSKMVTSVTTLGYMVMTFLHYWPFGGWWFHYRKMLADKGASA